MLKNSPTSNFARQSKDKAIGRFLQHSPGLLTSPHLTIVAVSCPGIGSFASVVGELVNVPSARRSRWTWFSAYDLVQRGNHAEEIPRSFTVRS